MTDKMICPFCGAELEEDNEFIFCPTTRCPLWECEGVPYAIIKTLIDGKKAQDALNYVLPQLDAYMNMYLETRRNPLEFRVAKEYIDNIKNKIASITTGKDE